MSAALIFIAYWAIGIAWYRTLCTQLGRSVGGDPGTVRWLLLPPLWLPLNAVAAVLVLYTQIRKGAA